MERSVGQQEKQSALSATQCTQLVAAPCETRSFDEPIFSDVFTIKYTISMNGVHNGYREARLAGFIGWRPLEFA